MQYVKVKNAVFVRSTESAVLVRIEGEQHWIPESTIHDDSDIWQGGTHKTGTLVCTARIADQKGFAKHAEEYEG